MELLLVLSLGFEKNAFSWSWVLCCESSIYINIETPWAIQMQLMNGGIWKVI